MFKKGQIIRKTTSLKCPIGAYMRIVSARGNTVTAEVIGSNAGQLYCLPKKRVRIYTIKSLVISEDLLYRLKSGQVEVVQHRVDMPWQDMYENPTELVRFHTMSKGYEAIFTVYSVQKKVSLREPVILMTLGEKI